MKVELMDNAIDKCDESAISRYIDGELPENDISRVKRHLAGCDACRKRLEAFQNVGRLLTTETERVAGDIDFTRLRTRILSNNPPKKQSLLSRLFGDRPRWRIWAPAAAVSLALLLFVVLPKPGDVPVTAYEPSAIVESFSSNVSTVMFMETPESRQTIIWIKEEQNTDEDRMSRQPNDIFLT